MSFLLNWLQLNEMNLILIDGYEITYEMILASWPYAQRNFKKEAFKDIRAAPGIKLVLPDSAWLLLPTERQGLSVESAANFSGLFIIVKGILWQLIQINCTCSYLPVPQFLFICATMGKWIVMHFPYSVWKLTKYHFIQAWQWTTV